MTRIGNVTFTVFLVILVAGQATASEWKRLERFKGETARIVVTHRDQSVTRGAGVVLCQEGGRAYVLTAYRLFVTGGQGVLRRPSRTEVQFYDPSVASVVDDRSAGEPVITFHQEPDEGLLLLSFPVPAPLPVTVAGRTSGWIGLRWHEQPVVYALGHRDSPPETWVLEEGNLLPGGDRFLHHSVPLPEGFLGGPLWNKGGKLIGVNLRRVAGEEIGAESGELYGEALSARYLLETVGKWVPKGCLSNVDTWVENFLPEALPEPMPIPASSVTLYEHSSFVGVNETFYHDDEDLRDNSIGNDRVSSVKVAPGCQAVLYEHAGYQGAQTILKGDVENLRASEVGNDSVTSLKVRCDVERLVALPAGLGAQDSEAAAGPLSDPVGEPATPPEVSSTAKMLRELTQEKPGDLLEAASVSERRRQETADLLKLKEGTVMITVTFEDQSVEHGTGVVMCRDDDLTFVLTAHHVLTGKHPQTAASSARRVARTEITSFRGDLPSVVDDPAAGQDVLTVHSMPEQDLALVSFRTGIAWPFSAEVRPASWTRLVQQDRPEVVALGYSGSSMETWAAVGGSLVPGDSRFVYHTAPVVEGFSGGPLFHVSGPLVGVNLERFSVLPRGEGGGSVYGKALAIEEVLPWIAPWLPEGCRRDLEGELDRFGFFAEAVRTVADYGRFGRKYRFGPYQVTGFKVTLTDHVPGRWAQRVHFSLDDSGGATWDAQCKDRTRAKLQGRVKPMGIIKLLRGKGPGLLDVVGFSRPDFVGHLDCEFRERGGERVVGLVLDGSDRIERVEGVGEVGAGQSMVEIEALGTRFDVWYLMRAEGRLVAAVHRDEVWLHPSLVGEVHTASVLASAMLLPYTGFYME